MDKETKPIKYDKQDWIAIALAYLGCIYFTINFINIYNAYGWIP